MLTRAAEITRFPGDPKVLCTGPSSLGAPDQLARGLGWFSIGLGVLEIFAARSLARSLGMQGAEGLIRGYGVREIASGMACLSVNPVPGVASRIAGDALDIATLAAALPDNPKRENVQLALLAVLGVTALDILCTTQLRARHGRPAGPGRDYGDRSGFPYGVASARGAAREAP
ncbi:hypothetical protein [Roseomonas marmotae]|nr:hypothetical protein [Roseomonas marmotae]